MRFPYVPRDGIYKVIDTDVGGKDAKGSYSIVYGCSHILGIKRVESVFILTRDKLVVGQAKWNDMQKKIFGIIKDKFSYTGGATNYWDPSWYTNTV